MNLNLYGQWSLLSWNQEQVMALFNCLTGWLLELLWVWSQRRTLDSFTAGFTGWMCFLARRSSTV